MKSILTLALLFSSAMSFAQLTQDEVSLIQSKYGKGKRELVQSYITFKDNAKATKFWKLYDAYEAERKQIGKEYLNLLQQYADQYEKLDDSKADALVKKMATNNRAYDDLLMKYYDKMKPEIGALTASQFIQLENYLRTVIKSYLLDEIPFIGEIDRTKK